jgi:hypothetical protein
MANLNISPARGAAITQMINAGSTIRDVAAYFHLAPSTVVGYLSYLRRKGHDIPLQPMNKISSRHNQAEYATCIALGITWRSEWRMEGQRHVLFSMPAIRGFASSRVYSKEPKT